jgi:hypothetical protein
VEEAITVATSSFGFSVRKGHPVDPVEGHGFPVCSIILVSES